MMVDKSGTFVRKKIRNILVHDERGAWDKTDWSTL